MLFLLWNLLCFGTPICNSAFSFNYTFIYSGVIKYDKCGIEEVWERRREKSNKGQGVGVLGLVTMVRKRYMWLEREFLCHIHGRWINFLFFTHFPNELRAKDMRNVFAKYGDISKVLFPHKRDKYGNHFGFKV